ncbi:hypothetical protein [Primorskyibacter flagellatus]|uniref:Replication initiation factor n=1 Tax=Primorskyibacter flagellatus TaxID=1387277 RepID=A0A1W2ETK4_9RHOB|nr:hypothetical protein [Primorskyibacter flagellatus]SMD13050.1 hypothetical protein SAMN06295998_1461 [Primorskyibacter flagellatus]
MDAQILHSGFDGLKFTIQTDIPPALRSELVAAKDLAKKTHSDCIVNFGTIKLSVTGKGARGFTAHTGDHGAVWLFQDPEDRIPNNPGITVDFRAFGLATSGLEGAEQHFRACMDAFAIPYVETQLRVARADFAVDFLATWFEPNRDCLVVPPGTKVTEYTGVDETATVSSGARVTGLRAGTIANRQIAIYDKRAEVIQSNKLGWLTIWNAASATIGEAPLDLTDRNTSQVWRFELRLGSKQLRNRFELRNWQDIRSTIGDAFTDATKRIRYCEPTHDRNRARWPAHDLWRMFDAVIGNDLRHNCCGVLPSDVIHANRAAKMRELDAQICGLFVSRAAISGVSAEEFSDFMETHVEALLRTVEEHSASLEERLAKAQNRYRLAD